MDVDGISVASAEALQGQLIDTIAINGSGHLVFTRNNGEVIDAGNVMRPILDSWPIGSIYMSVNPANPSTYLGGGNWTPWGVGRMPVGVDGSQSEFNAVEETGGSKTAALALANMPSHYHSGTTAQETQTHRHAVDIVPAGQHNHPISRGDSNQTGGSGNRFAPGTSNTLGGSGNTLNDGEHDHDAVAGVNDAKHTHTFQTDAKGTNTAFSILNPYITCYMWKRTA